MGRIRVGQRRFVAAAMLAVAVGGVAACGGSGGGGDPAEGEESRSSTTTASPESTTTTLSPTQEVEEAFLAFKAMLQRLAQSPNPDDPEIVQRATGDTLAGVRQFQTTLQTLGHRAEYGARQATHILAVSTVDAATVTLRECTVDDRTEITPTGTIGPVLETYWTEWTLREVDGTWFVDGSEAIDMRQGEQPCE